MSTKGLVPKLLTIFKEGYSVHQLLRDLTAGVVVGIVALPLAIAFAIASGVRPEQGLYTAIIAGFVIAALGGSRVQVSGPTGAFIVVVYGVVEQYGYQGLAVATILAGFMLISMGLLGLGTLLKFVPYPLTVGFTSGIALIIFSSQAADFLGLRVESMPADFLPKWQVIYEHIATVNFAAMGMGMLSLLIIIYLPKISPRLPASLVALVAATLLVQHFHLDVETIGSRFGAMPSVLPAPSFLSIDWDTLQELFKPAFTIALLGGIESLLSAVVADGMLGTRHRSNMELVAQGVGNVVSPLFQGIPATGAIARTATNIKNGGRTPVAALVHTVVIFAIVYWFGEYAALIPMSALAAILISVAYNMSEWHAFVRILKYPGSDIAVLLTTFFLTVLIDLTVAIQIGVVLSAFLFVSRMEETAGVSAFFGGEQLNGSDEAGRDFLRRDIPKNVEVFEAFGPIFFSAVDRFTNALARVEKKIKFLILYMPRVNAIDGSGLRAIQSISEKLAREKCTLLIAGADGQPLDAIKRAQIVDEADIFSTLEGALQRAAPQQPPAD